MIFHPTSNSKPVVTLFLVFPLQFSKALSPQHSHYFVLSIAKVHE